MAELMKILTEYEQADSEFMLTCHQIKPEDRLKGSVCGFWSPKQVVDHLTGWTREALEKFKRIQAGESVNLEYDDDTFNAQSVAERSKLNWDDTLADLKDAGSQLINFTGRLSLEDQAKSGAYASWIKGITEDLRLHQTQLQQWV